MNSNEGYWESRMDVRYTVKLMRCGFGLRVRNISRDVCLCLIS